ncbi:MAG: hypothetical protein GY846_15025 [Deltaproteobacteria bacterium]|nr:hypothetical protein [Deltaproteobacteria bacterium]
MDICNTHKIMSPKRVASEREGSVGQSVLENIHEDEFRGKVYAVKLGRNEILGMSVYPSFIYR